MVIQPLGTHFGVGRDPRSVWPAIEVRQRTRAASYLLVSQPDHARLSGDLAREFVSPAFPRLSPETIDAIGAHDHGWSQLPGESAGHGLPMVAADGKPRSFIEFAPSDFTRAWTGSIDHAASLSAVGGILVSRHFACLGESALRRFDQPDERTVLRNFLGDEMARRRALEQQCTCLTEELDEGVKALQFCDLLSLALCCGVTEAIEFPQCFGGRAVTMRCGEGVYELSPSPLQSDGSGRRTVTCSVRARSFPECARSDLTFVLR